MQKRPGSENTKPPQQRRAHARFETSMCVEFKNNAGQKEAAFSVNLSQSGMLLRDPKGLEPHTETEFSMPLYDGNPPLRIRGRVLDVTQSRGARVQFVEGQDDAFKRLKRFITDVVVPGLETEVADPKCEPKYVVELASMYADAGRSKAAMEVFRTFWERRGPNLELAEAWVRLMAATFVPNAAPEPALLAEIEAVTEAGLALGNSDVLEAARDTLEVLFPHAKQ